MPSFLLFLLCWPEAHIGSNFIVAQLEERLDRVAIGESEPDLVLDELDFGLSTLDVESSVEIVKVNCEVPIIIQETLHEGVDFWIGFACLALTL